MTRHQIHGHSQVDTMIADALHPNRKTHALARIRRTPELAEYEGMITTGAKLQDGDGQYIWNWIWTASPADILDRYVYSV